MAKCLIVRSYDGVIQDHDVMFPTYSGTYEECVDYLRKMPSRQWNKVCSGKSFLEIVNEETQRIMSYVL